MWNNKDLTWSKWKLFQHELFASSSSTVFFCHTISIFLSGSFAEKMENAAKGNFFCYTWGKGFISILQAFQLVMFIQILYWLIFLLNSLWMNTFAGEECPGKLIIMMSTSSSTLWNSFSESFHILFIISMVLCRGIMYDKRRRWTKERRRAMRVNKLTHHVWWDCSRVTVLILFSDIIPFTTL